MATKKKPGAAKPRSHGRTGNPVGRPKGSGLTHEPTPEKKAEIIERLAQGEFLTLIVRNGWNAGGPNADQPMPSRGKIYLWGEADEEFREQIARAREEGAVALVEECPAIADDSSEDFRQGPKGMLVETDSVGRAKLRVWTRLQMADRINPKNLAPGKRIMDGDGGALVPAVIEVVGVEAHHEEAPKPAGRRRK